MVCFKLQGLNDNSRGGAPAHRTHFVLAKLFIEP